MEAGADEWTDGEAETEEGVEWTIGAGATLVGATEDAAAGGVDWTDGEGATLTGATEDAATGGAGADEGSEAPIGGTKTWLETQTA